MRAFTVIEITISAFLFVLGMVFLVVGLTEIPVYGAKPDLTISIGGLSTMVVAMIRLMLVKVENRRFN